MRFQLEAAETVNDLGQFFSSNITGEMIVHAIA